jgi:hypothetical protein
VVACVRRLSARSDQLALDHLQRADYLTGHNIQGYDLPLLRRLHGWTPAIDCTVVDTLITARLILPNVADLDDQAAAMGSKSLGKLRGRYSLEAWGERHREDRHRHRGLVAMDAGNAGALCRRYANLQSAVALPAACRLQPRRSRTGTPGRADLR